MKVSNANNSNINLPPELWSKILSDLDVVSLGKLAQVSKFFVELLRSEGIWNNVAKRMSIREEYETTTKKRTLPFFKTKKGEQDANNRKISSRDQVKKLYEMTKKTESTFLRWFIAAYGSHRFEKLPILKLGKQTKQFNQNIIDPNKMSSSIMRGTLKGLNTKDTFPFIAFRFIDRSRVEADQRVVEIINQKYANDTKTWESGLVSGYLADNRFEEKDMNYISRLINNEPCGSRKHRVEGERQLADGRSVVSLI